MLPRFTRYPDYRFQIGEVAQRAVPGTAGRRRSPTTRATAEFELDLKRFVGRAYRLNVLARAFEAEGGRNVAAQNSAIVSDAPYLVGVKPDGDLTLRAARQRRAKRTGWPSNQQLKPVAADGLTLEWVQRKFVSVLTQQDNGTCKYVSQPDGDRARQPRRVSDRRRRQPRFRCRPRSPATSCWCCATPPAPSSTG